MNMAGRWTLISGLLALQLVAALRPALAGDLKIPLPQRDPTIPTQKLNREGVAELKRGHREKAKQLFYRAYLLDPNDPFTLNNLGYVAELDGDADRALRYYALAAQDHTDAVIAESNERTLKGKPLEVAFQQVKDSDREVSRINEQAIVFLEQGKVFEARNLLRSAMPSHPRNAFLLNNLGYALETVGDLDGALRNYSAAASLHSMQPVVVSPRARWRGRPISQVAAENAAAVSELISRGEGVEAATARLNLRGVAALNDNNPSAAREFFQQAYRRDSQNAFTLNNLGYLAELDGDSETAESYYEAARTGRDAKERVSYSTRRQAEGQPMDSLADNNQSSVEGALKAEQEIRRHTHQPVDLIRRDGNPVAIEPATQVPPVGVQAPPLPALPPPGSDQQLPDSTKNPNRE